jgi:hypothetical protein
MQTNSATALSELRQLERHEITQLVSVFDTFSGETLGNLVNVSTGGLMLVSQQPIDSNRIYQVTLSLPEEVLEGIQIELVIDCLWSKQAGTQSAHWSGFCIVDASESDMNAFDSLVESANQ